MLDRIFLSQLKVLVDVLLIESEQWERMNVSNRWSCRFATPAAQNSEHSGRVRKNEGGSSAGGAKEFDPKHPKGLYL